ncbi:MAG: SufE family protein [Cyclobacteriaceae bacterium]
MTIQDKQEEIIEEFSLLDGDMEMSINYLMELGEQLPSFPEEKRNDDYIVKGCQSKVWLNAELSDNLVRFDADSNTAITKGLVRLLVRVFENEKPDNILASDIHFPSKIGMGRFIGTQRSNGFSAMIKQIKLYALALKTKTTA